jgi:hypothetical protein
MAADSAHPFDRSHREAVPKQRPIKPHRATPTSRSVFMPFHPFNLNPESHARPRR